MSIPHPPYSLNTTIAAIRSYYAFLLNTHPRLESPSDSPPNILEPPADGWSEIDVDLLAPLGKTATVVELLRHLPYLVDKDLRGHDVVAPERTRIIQYNGGDIIWCFNEARERGSLGGLLEPVGAGKVPPHVVALSESGRNGSWWLLDTEEGTRGSLLLTTSRSLRKVGDI